MTSTQRRSKNNSNLYVPGGDTECRTGNGIMGCTVLCGLFDPLFHFVYDILHPRPAKILQTEKGDKCQKI